MAYAPSDPKIRFVRQAIWDHDVQTVIRELAADAALLQSSNSFSTPPGNWLHAAVDEGLDELVTWLLDQGLDINAKEGSDSRTPLSVASGDGHLSTARLLLDHGAKIEVSKSVSNPLFCAIVPGHVELASLLIERGIDTKIRYSGESMLNMDAWTFAMEQNQSEIAVMLDSEGRTYKPGDGRRPPDPWTEHVKESAGNDEATILKPILPTGDGVEIIAIFGQRNNMLLVTKGLSNHPLRDADGVYRHELFIVVDAEWNIDESLEDDQWSWPLRWLFGVARRLIEEQRSPAHEDFIDCREWSTTPAGYAGVLFLPTSSALPPLEDEAGPIDPLWLFPVYAGEVSVVVKEGARALLTRFRNAGLPMHCTQSRANFDR